MADGRERVLADIDAELVSQDDRWGPQNHVDGTGPSVWWGLVGPAADVREMARDITEIHAHETDGLPLTWLDILREEVAEAFAEGDVDTLRAELIQVAAVAAQWVEAIDRREPVTD
jgi:hypothetical protein